MYFYFAQCCLEFIFKETFLSQIGKTKPIFENVRCISFYNGLPEKIDKKKRRRMKERNKEAKNREEKKEEN